jgi:phosphate transport system permease protein
MSQPMSTTPRSAGHLPEGEASRRNVAQRQRRGRWYERMLLATTSFAIVILLVLLYNVIDDAFGGIATQTAVDPAELTGGRALTDLTDAELVTLLEDNLRRRVLRSLEREQPLAERTREDVLAIIDREVVKSEVVGIYTLTDYLLHRDQITAALAEAFPRAELRFKSWISPAFLTTPMSSEPADAGIRTALLGSLWVLLLTVLIAFPLGIGAAIFLEEYESEVPFDERTAVGRALNRIYSRINTLIALNIYNLAGVPSIIYGILGLAVFVRTFEPFTSGAAFSGADGTANGRTVISAAATMALLVLPVIIISSQEAIRAVPNSLRQASYGLGATRWQTVWRIVLPNALPGILTGTILAVSRAIGETAPLIVVGASTFIVSDPSGPFSKFTVLPIQIYNWTSRPQDEFRAIAAAAIIVLLVMLLSINAVAIIMRNYLRQRRVG